MILGHLARAERLGHELGAHAEEVAFEVRPPALDLVVRGHADDGVLDACDHAGAHGYVGCGDVCADDRERALLGHIAVEGGEHHLGPTGTAAPEQASGEHVAPCPVVDGARGAGEGRRGLVAVDAHPAEVEDVEDLNLRIFGDAGLPAHALDRARDGHRGSAVAGAHGRVHDGDEGCRTRGIAAACCHR